MESKVYNMNLFEPVGLDNLGILSFYHVSKDENGIIQSVNQLNKYVDFSFVQINKDPKNIKKIKHKAVSCTLEHFTYF